jgi:hypothetical protein
VVTHIWEPRWFKTMYTMQGKPNTHDTYASCTGPRTPHIRYLWAVPVHGNLSCWPNRVGHTLLLPRKRASDTIPYTSADQSTGPPPSFSPNITIEAVMNTKHLLMNRLHRSTGPISPVCDQYVQYLLTGANPSVLNQHRWGYNLGGASLPLHTPQPSQPMVLRFPPKGPAWSPN